MLDGVAQFIKNNTACLTGNQSFYLVLMANQILLFMCFLSRTDKFVKK